VTRALGVSFNLVTSAARGARLAVTELARCRGRGPGSSRLTMDLMAGDLSGLAWPRQPLLPVGARQIANVGGRSTPLDMCPAMTQSEIRLIAMAPQASFCGFLIWAADNVVASSRPALRHLNGPSSRAPLFCEILARMHPPSSLGEVAAGNSLGNKRCLRKCTRHSAPSLSAERGRC